MSFIDDVQNQLEALIRAAVPDVPAGTEGLERGVRLPSSLSSSELPHVMFADEAQRAAPLRLRQQRTSLAFSIFLVRRGSTHAQMLADFGAIEAALLADRTLTGVVETSQLELEGIDESLAEPEKLLRMSFSAVKVF